jgi:hypothetical protein
MQQTFTIKRGDTGPRLTFALTPAAEVVLTGATVRFNMRSRQAGTVRVNRAAAVIVTATGTPTVAYDWQAGDTAVAELCDAEFEVTYAGGAVETFPNNDFITVVVTGDIA